MKTLSFCLLFCIILGFSSANLFSQNVAITDDNGYSADPSAMLDVKSTTKGMLVPRVTTIQRNAIVSPANGLLVFDINEGNFYFHNGTSWINLTSSTNSIWTKTGQDVHLSTGTDNVGVGTNNPLGKLEVKGDVPVSSNDPLFEVINSHGDTVFAVFSQGVQVRVADEPAFKASSSKSGFAIGGFSLTKGLTNEYMRVSPDSVRIYIDKNGGTKATGSKGGFAIGGFSLTKSLPDDFFNISGADSAEVINPAEARIIWYPIKKAMFSGNVLIESVDSVGTMSIASGNEPKAIGSFSQAFGFHPRAFGENSTAIGNYANAEGQNSYALGNYAKTENIGSYAIGSGANASGYYSFALGSIGVDSSGAATFPTLAYGNYSYAFGMGAVTFAQGAFAFGTQDTASGQYSLSMGYRTKASGSYSTAMGKLTLADGYQSTAMGYKTISSGGTSLAYGYEAEATGNISIAMGYQSLAYGDYSVGIGRVARALGDQSYAMGTTANAFSDYSTAIGYYVTANATYATARGSNTTASGQYSTSFGRYTTASGSVSTTLGQYTTAQSYNSLVIGRYNLIGGNIYSWVATDPLFVIGNGSSDAARSNALVVYKNGNTEINGNLTFNAGVNSVTLPANRGTNGYVLTTDGAGNSSWVATVGDNLGNHAATQNLDMNAYNIIDVGNIGIGTSSPAYNLHIYKIGDATFKLESDYNNNGENDNPRFELSQDGNIVIGGIGLIGSADQYFIGSLANGMYMVNDYNSPLQLGTNNTARITIGSGGAVGIGTTSPNALLTVKAESTIDPHIFLGSTEGNTEGLDLWYDNSTGYTYFDNVYSNGKMHFRTNNGANSGITIDNTGRVGIGMTTPVHALTVYAAGTETMRLYADGSAGSGAVLNWGDLDYVYISEPTDDRMRIQATRVGLRRDPTANSFEVEGTASKTTAGDWAANSDKRIKTDIQDIDNSIELIKQLRPVKFKYTKEWCEKHPSIENKYYYNFIAQEYGKIFPESMKGSGEYLDGDKEEILQIDTYNAQIIAIKAVQELVKENETLNIEVDQLKKANNTKTGEINNLKAEIEKIKSILSAISIK